MMGSRSVYLLLLILQISILYHVPVVKAQDVNIYFSTFFGESLSDSGEDVTIDGDGNIYLLGGSNHLIVDELTIDLTAGNTPLVENRNIFLNKYSDTGQLLSKFIIGGGDFDYAEKVLVDSSGDIIIIGNTRSQDFPVYNSSLTVADGGNNDTYEVGFVTKLSQSGETLWSGILGGSDGNLISSATIDSNDDILLGINTRSTDFPIVEGSEYTSTTETGQDIVICKLSNSGQIIWSTYLVGNREDGVNDITVDSDNNIYLTGYTDSVDFPGLNFREYQYNEVFVVKYSPQGDLIWSIVRGGGAFDEGRVIAFNPIEESIIIAGSTNSRSFPTTVNDPSFDDLWNKAFVYHVNLTGEILSSYIFAGYVHPFDIEISSDGIIYLTGYYEIDYGTENYQPDVIINKFSPNGNSRANTTFGGQSGDIGFGIVQDQLGRLIVVGATSSFDFPLVNPLDSVMEVGEAFLTILEDNIVLPTEDSTPTNPASPTEDEPEPTRSRISWTPLPIFAVIVLGVAIRSRSRMEISYKKS